MDSMRVSEGWEVYLCTSTNNSSCGIYGEGLHRNINGGIYSMTAMPSTFEYAMKYYGIKEIGQSGTEPTGFAYLYNIPEYNYSTSQKRMFIKQSDSTISDLSNYIVKNNQISSVELFGDMILLFGKPSSLKQLNSSHRNFGWFGYDNNNSYLDFRDWDNAINYVMPLSVPSVGWFFAGNSPEEGEIRGICFDGVNDFPQESDPAPKIECITNGQNHYAYKTNVDGGGSYNYNEFFNRLVVTNDQGIRHSRERLKRYGDSHDLLFFSAHGSFDYGRANISISPGSSGEWIESNEPNWANYIGDFKTKWMMTDACQSMGKDGVDINPDVINAYKKSLERLSGVGGQRNDAWFGPLGVDDESYFDFWDELDSEPISETYVDSWSNDVWWGYDDEENDWLWMGRDARYMTRENCDCNNTSCDSYMFDDYFPTVSTGPKAKKNQSQLSTYNRYCVRDDDGDPANYVVNSLNRSATVESKYDTDVYSKENPVAKIYQTYEMPPEIAGEIFDVEVSESGKTKYRDEYTHFTLDGRRLFYKGTEKLSPIDDEYPISENDYEKLFLDEATGIAEQLTTLPIVFDKISLDQTTSFIDQEYMIEMESIKTNKVSYIYVPVLDGIPMIFNKIEIQFDAKGLYKIKSFAPYSVEEIGYYDLKSSEDVISEVRTELKNDEIPFDTREIVYTIEKDGTARMKYIFADKKEKLIKTVSMEADYEK